MKIVFFGTSPLAQIALRALHESAHDVTAVFSQPDKPAGRGRKLTAPPAAAYAKQQGIPLHQPDSLRSDEVLTQLQELAPELIVVAAYGKMIPNNILDLPPHRCINIHPSLLPKYRGAAPINWPILNGDTETGVSIMYLVEEMDAGDVLMQERVAIEADETALELHDRLADIGAALLLQTIAQLESGTAQATAQDPSAVTFAPKFTKEQGQIDWAQPAQTIINQIRGLQPWPTAFTHINDTALKIYRAEIPENHTVPKGVEPGEIIETTRSIDVACDDGRLSIVDLQLAGKKRMSSQDLLRGYDVKVGTVLK